MALQKQIEQDNGVSANYHKIINMTVDNGQKKASISVASYVSKEMRDAGKRPLAIQNISSISCPNGTLAECYVHLKSLAKYSGASDV